MQIRSTALALCAVALAAVISSAASAQLPYGVGVPITVPTDNVTVTLFFDSSSALYTGNLYFLGSGDADNVLNPAPNTDPTNQGFFAFSNHAVPVGTSVIVPGVFNAGDVLHFAYDIVAPSTATTDVLRTDVEGDQMQFAWDPENSFFKVEDRRLDNPLTDLDYNDIVVSIAFTPIPGPGALALLGVAAVLGRGRRRG